VNWDSLPPRVEGVIEARIGHLQRELHAFLSVASVEGEEFTAQVVAQVQRMGERQALHALSGELEKRYRLVREQPALCVGRHWLSRYRFSHALFQQYLYHELGEGERALLHGEIARTLEALYEGRAEEIVAIAPQLAYHYAEAGDDQRTLKYLALAGDAALAAYANEEAEGYYRRALALMPGERLCAQLLSGLGEALSRQGRFQEAIATCREGIECYRALEDHDGLARLYARGASAAEAANDPAAALRLCLEGLAEVQGAPESPGLAHLLNEAARAYGFNAQREQAAPLAEQAQEMAERLVDVEVQAQALATLGDDLGVWTGERALEALGRALELAEAHGLLLVEARARLNLAHATIIYRADYGAGREHFRRAAELERQAGRTTAEIYALASLAYFSMPYGALAEARRLLARISALLADHSEPSKAAEVVLHMEMRYLGFRGEWQACARQARARWAWAREQGTELLLANAGYWLGWAELESARLWGDASAIDWEEAEAALTEAIEIHDRSPYFYHGVEGRVWLGSLRISQGRLDDARRLLAEAQAKASSQSYVLGEAFTLLLAAQIAEAEGRWAAALAAYEAAAGIYVRYGARWYWARWLLDWAGAHVARGEAGDPERARELLREAQTAFQDMGVPRIAAIAEARLRAIGAASAISAE
jgi:predicted ATPase